MDKRGQSFGYSEFFKLWSSYQIAVDNRDHIRMFHYNKYGALSLETMSLSSLNEVKRAVMLEF